MKTKHFLLVCTLFVQFVANAQMKIGNNPTTINSASVLELEATDKGFVLPRLALSDVASSSPLPTGLLTGTVVYNTSGTTTGGSGAGVYYWDGSKWVFLTNGSSVTSSAWLLTGNTGTNASSNFIGTTDAIDFVAKTANTERMRILGAASGSSKAGWIGMGITVPRSSLDVQGHFTNKNVLTLENSSTSGFSSVDMMDSAGNLSATFGYANLGTGTSFSGKAYFNGYGNDFLFTRGSSYDLLMKGSNGYIGLNTSTPSERLHVVGNIYLNGAFMPGGSAGTTGYVLTSAGTNTSPTWSNLNGLSWGVTGNSGTSYATNFLGTTDNVSMRFRTNNVLRMIIDSVGNTGIGLANPSYRLSVLSASNPLYLSGVQATSTFSSDSLLVINGGVVKKSPVTASGAFWRLEGNAGSNFATNFLGTTDNVSMRFRTNNTLRMIIDSTGKVGVGLSNPGNALSVLAASNPLYLSGVQATSTLSIDSVLTITGGIVKKIAYSDFTAATTNTLTLNTNTLTSTVNGVVATSNAVSGVSNTSSANTLSTTVNGVTGVTVPIINSNTGTWTQNGGITSIVNGVSANVTPASGTLNNVLGYNSNGVPVYQALSGLTLSTAWNLLGNSGTSYANNFLGTTDNVSMRFRTNNVQRMIIDSTGKVGIGLSNPGNALSVLAASNPLYLSGVQATSTLISDSLLTINGGIVKKSPYSALNNNYWSLTGNAGTNSSTNFLGTSDNVGLSFRTNNTQKVYIDSVGSVGIGSTSFDPSYREKLLVDYGNTASHTVATYRGSIDDYFQINLQNTSSGTSASSDYVATADDGTDSTYYVDFGINSSTYAPSIENWGSYHDAYLYSNSRNLLIGTQSANSDLIFMVGGGKIARNTAMRIGSPSGNIIIGKGEGTASPVGNIIRAPQGSGTNITGGNLTLQGGTSTGTATGGSLNLYGGFSGSAAYSAVNIIANPFTITGLPATSTFTTDSILVINGTTVKKAAYSALTSATTNTLTLSTNTLTSTVNGVAATSNAVSGVSNTSSANTLSTTVNGVTGSTVPIVNTNTNALTQAGGLVNTVNGVAATTSIASGTVSNVLGYNAAGTAVYQSASGILSGATTNTLTLSTNTLTSTVNGVAATSNAVSGVSNTSSANTLSTTVNGVTGSTAAIINTNTNALTQAGGLVNTVNGVAATTSIASGTVSNVLGYNSSGSAVYQSLSNITLPTAWSLTGNSGTSYATNFLGTTDNVSMRFRTNNTQRMIIDSTGKVGIGTSSPASDLTIYQSSGSGSSKGFTFTGNSIGGTNTGTGFLMSLGYNSTGNKQLWLGDADYAGNVAGSFARFVTTGTVFPVIDAVSGDNSLRRYLAFGVAGDANSGVIFGGDNTSVNPGSQVWDNGNMTIGAGYKSYAAPSNGLLVQGSVGIGTASAPNTLSVLAASNPLYLSGVQATATFSLDSLLTINAGVVKKSPYSSLTSNFWSTTGNSGTTYTTNFLGTTDNISMRFRTNNTLRMIIDSTGKVGIGLSNPSNALSVLASSDPLYLSGVQATATFSSDSILTINAGVVKKAPYSSLPTASGGGWSLTGNSISSGQFLGTTNSQALIFKYNSTSAGYLDANNTSLGTSSTATGGSSNTSIGYSSTAANSATAVGASANAANVANTAIGNSALANGSDHETAIGASSQATNQYNTAVGYNAQATTNAYASAFGTNALATGYQSVALGTGTTANKDQTVAIGYNAQATGQYGIAIGNAAQAATNTQTIAIGVSSLANAQYNTALGYNAQAISNTQATSIGSSSQANAIQATALGYNAKAISNGQTTAIGSSAQANAQYNTAVGYNAQAITNSQATAIGSASVASSQYATAVGYNAQSTTNSYGSAYGTNSNTSGQFSTAIGAETDATGQYSTALGYNAQATTNNQTTALGANTVANSSNATAVGYNAKAQASNATAIGYNAATSQANALVLGDATSTVNVGIGTATPNTTTKLDVAGSFKLGSGGSVVKNIATGSGNVNATLASLAFTDVTISLSSTLSSTAGTVNASPNFDFPTGIVIAFARIISTTTVKVRIYNASLASQTVSGTIYTTATEF